MATQGRPEIQYLPVEIDLLFSEVAQVARPFQIYTLLGDQYLPYMAPGSLLTEEIRQKLRKSGTAILYIDEKDKLALRDYLDRNLGGILQDSSLTPETKSKVVYDVCMYNIETLWATPRAEVIEKGKEIFRLTVDYMVSLSRHGIEQMLRMISYDRSVYAHSVNVGLLGTVLAKEVFERSDCDLHEIGYAMFLHDIGKTRIDYQILVKPGRLSADEWEVMKRHPEMGYRILTEEGQLSPASAITTLQHHERFDGKGYPRKLKGSEIDPLGKICNLVDGYDALLARRSYKPAFSPFRAMRMIQEGMQDPVGRPIFEKFVYLFRTTAAVSTASGLGSGLDSDL